MSGATMRERELRNYADCSMCGRKIGATGIPLFSRVTIERFGIDVMAVHRQQGIGMMLGARLAMHMGADEVMAKRLAEPVVLSICESCALLETMVHQLAELPAVKVAE